MSALTNFIRISDALIQFNAEICDNSIAQSSIHCLEVHKEELREIWQRVKPTYETCLIELSTLAGEEAKIDLETVKARYQSTYRTYVNSIAAISECIETKRAPIAAGSNIPQHNVDHVNSPHIHLPPCDTELFHGDYASWPTFRDLFTAIYIKNSRLSPVEKLFHLNNKTRGEAKEVVQKAPLTNDGFDVAWEALKLRFENKRLLINTQLKTLFHIEKISSESGNSIKCIQATINSVLSALKLYDIDVGSWDPIFVYICSTRLPENTLSLWEHSVKNKTECPPWNELDLFLTSRYQTLETVSDLTNPSTSSAKKDNPKVAPGSYGQKRVSSYQNGFVAPDCKLCPNHKHTIRLCPQLVGMCYSERLSCVKRYKLCINCFAKGHSAKECKSTFNCLKCQRRHNTLLHQDNIVLPPQEPTTSANTSNIQSTPISNADTFTSDSDHVQSFAATNSKLVLLGTAIVYIVHNGDVFKARALLDSGSEASFISEHLFSLLKLKGKSISTQISGLNGTVSAKSHKICSIQIGSPIDSNLTIRASTIVIPKLTASLPTFYANPKFFADLPNLQLADPNFFQTSYVDLLIGADLFPKIMLNGMRNGICGSLMAQRTVFGWILSGPVQSESISSFRTTVSYCNEVALDNQISKFWEVEDFPREKLMSEYDQYCEDNFKATTKRDSTGRYIVTLPFKAEFPTTLQLGQSRKRAMAQFIQNETRLLKNKALKDQYCKVLDEYIELGHMREVPSPNLANGKNEYYLPHHAVIRPDSLTTKVRVVFNASSPSSNGHSLNDILHCGPSLQLDLITLLLKWRFYKIVFNSDIEKMYRQIVVDANHTPFQKVLYRSSSGENIKEFQLQTVTFGVNCAPYLALRTIQQLAEDVKDTHPLANSILKSSMYVDDVLAGSHDIHTAIQMQTQLISALSSAGFSLRKWTSNSKEFLRPIPKEYLLNQEFLDFDDSSIAKTLGIRWNAKLDIFCFHAKSIKFPVTPTKRQVLSEISKLFDPAGWLCPYLVTAKLLMRDLWATKVGWDDELPTNFIESWKIFVEHYSEIGQIQIPRWIGYSPDCDIQLHGFCDASERAYAGAIYMRIATPRGCVRTFLLTAKSRVSPLKTISIPRLELCGALLLAETIDSLMPSLPIQNCKIFCWTDSTIVLAWLKRPAYQWKTFVANRISKISEIISEAQWSHVPSKDNPADIASRGAYPIDLIQNKLWWSGPDWLKLPPSLWPIQFYSRFDGDLLEKKVHTHFSYFHDYNDLLDRFSTLDKALRVLSYVFRFIARCRPTAHSIEHYNSAQINTSEIQSVKTRLIQLSQKALYPNEYRSLSRKEVVSTMSTLSTLNPFMDPKGIMRVCGRIACSDSLTYDERYPIILPYRGTLTRLLLKFIHKITLHGGNSLMFRMLRLQFWVPRAKTLIKSIVHNCKVCVVAKHKLQTQLMAVLPPERTTLSRPFTNTGIDFAGPFDIKNYAARSCIITKGYVCVFVCFATRAIHLELTSSLTTPAFLACFHRFISRRGCPLRIYSDNGKTFVGASKELAQNFLYCSRNVILSEFSHQNVTWHFIPPGAPHMGGLWEAGVKSFKTHFRKMAGPHRFTFEEFSTVLVRVEACLNSRPISPLSENLENLLALTPGHFLIGGPLLSVAEINESDSNLSVLNRWRRVKALSQQFCTRWKHEYLKELHKRVKWKTPQPNVHIGSMVVVRDECVPPTEWRLGRISKIYCGKDNLVRVVDIRTQKGTITRPLVKIVLLPQC